MQMQYKSILSIICFTCISLSVLALDKSTFWDTNKKGANIFNKVVTKDDIKAAKLIGIKFIRLAPDKFISTHRDFLLSDADHYQMLDATDLKHLKHVLDVCADEQMPVVLTMLSLPGSRWKQNNGDQDDLRIWDSEDFQLQAKQFWRDLAQELKDHPAIVGYNILNEPHLERIYNPGSNTASKNNKQKIQQIMYKFYAEAIDSIRMVDQTTPIILDCTAHADPQTFEYFLPHSTKNILYSFHMYEPYEYTNAKINNGNFVYPGIVESKAWNKEALKEYMQPVINFQRRHNIPSDKILVGEFGGNRRSVGLDKYFQDLISIFNANGWHYAFYAFREDTWDGMDYELGNSKLPWSYWQAKEKGENPIIARNYKQPVFNAIINDIQK